MWKLYFKKLLLTALFFIRFALIGASLAFFTVLLANHLIPESVRFYACLFLAILIVLVHLYRRRCDSYSQKLKYLEGIEYAPPSFGKDFWQTLKSRENIVHTLAFLTLRFFTALPTGIITAPTIWRFLVGMFLLLLEQGIIFTLVNTLIWCLVHRRWSEYWRRAGQVTDRFENKE